MKLVASMMVGPGELGRYLTITAPHLLTFCDRLFVRCEGSDEYDYLAGLDRVDVWQPAEPTFFEHEGRARQELLTMTLETDATHVLSIDADELVDDGAKLRDVLEAHECPTYELGLAEVWRCDTDALWTREDGGWRTHPVPLVWRVPTSDAVEWRIRDAALACGRVPMMVEEYERMNCIEPTGCTVYHFGWANQAEREQRHRRYVEHDGGRYHNRNHLDSIMWPDPMTLSDRHDWPFAPSLRSKLVRAANG